MSATLRGSNERDAVAALQPFSLQQLARMSKSVVQCGLHINDVGSRLLTAVCAAATDWIQTQAGSATSINAPQAAPGLPRRTPVNCRAALQLVCALQAAVADMSPTQATQLAGSSGELMDAVSDMLMRQSTHMSGWALQAS
jgi:hypothetical protein